MNCFDFLGWLGLRRPSAQVINSSVGGDVVGRDKIIYGPEPAEFKKIILEMDKYHLAERARLPLYRPGFTRKNRDFESLSFKNDAIEFRGRTEEFGKIYEFLDVPKPFIWWVVSGYAGVGKSKFALELCLRVHGQIDNRNWAAGFLNGSDADRFKDWHANHDTLIVIDYAQRHADDVREGLLALARHCRSGSRVRVLLLDRSFDEDARARLFSSSRGELEALWYDREPLRLGTLDDDDIWETARQFFDAKTELPDRTEFFNRLTSIDPERRILVALIVAATYQAENAESPRDILTLMQAFLHRERANNWPSDPPIRATVEEPLIALATVAKGIRLNQVCALPDEVKQLIDQLDCGERNGCRLVTTCDQPDMLCGTLTPDLVGEFFALDMICKRRQGTGIADFPWLVETAWRLDGASTLDFALRSQRDFPSHPGHKAFLAPVSGVSEAHFLKIVRQVVADPTTSWARVILALRDQARIDVSIATAVATSGTMIISEDILNLGPNAKEIRDVLDLMALLAHDHSQTPFLRTAWANAVVNFIAFSDKEDLDQAEALVEAVAKEKRTYPDELHLRWAWAASVNNFVTHSAAKHAPRAHQFVIAVEAEAQAYPDDSALREQWIRAVTNFVDFTKGQEKDRSYLLIEAVTKEIRGHAKDATSREMWAKIVKNFVLDAAMESSDRACKLIDDVEGEMWAHPNEDALREQWASAVTNFIGGTAAQNPDKANRFIEAVAKEMRRHPDDSRLREQWASAVTNFVGRTAGLSEAARDGAHGLIKEVVAEIRTTPDDAALRKLWAWAVANFIGTAPVAIGTAATREYDRAHKLVEEVTGQMHAHPAEDALREEWAKVVGNFARIGWRDPDQYHALVESVKEEIRTHPDEKALWMALQMCQMHLAIDKVTSHVFKDVSDEAISIQQHPP